MANLKSKQSWVRTGQTFSAPYHLCEDTLKISKHEREVVSQVWEMEEGTGWEPGTWATLVREKLRVRKKND